jgi:hypothetical protein
MEARQNKNFNAKRARHIRRFRGLLAAAVVREQTRNGRNQPVFGSKTASPGASKPGAGVNLQGVNQNKREDKFANEAVRRGWTVIKRGWPDFLCWQGEEVIFVEVKPEGDSLSSYQKVVMQKLASLGLKCYRWTPESGFGTVTSETSSL